MCPSFGGSHFARSGTCHECKLVNLPNVDQSLFQRNVKTDKYPVNVAVDPIVNQRFHATIIVPMVGFFVVILASTGESVTIPILGEVVLEEQSILVSTILIGLIDGLNPCSLWVLSVLLGLVIHAGRKKAMLVGGTFLLVTASIYGLFIGGVLSVFEYIAHIDTIRIGVALFALGFALVSIKDYVTLGYGPSFSIPDSRKPDMYRRMRTAVQADGVASTLLATAIMAGGVALIELPCTAGFPIVWSNLVAVHDPAPGVYALLVSVYIAAYLIDELLIFGVVILTMTRISYGEKRGRVLKLFAGIVLFALGIAILVRPQLLESITETGGLFLVAAAMTILIVSIDHVTGWFTDTSK